MLIRSESAGSSSTDSINSLEEKFQNNCNGDNLSEDSSSSVESDSSLPTWEPNILSLPPKGASADCIRSRFLNRLGISSHSKSVPPMVRKIPETVRSDTSFREALKADYGLPDNSLSNTHPAQVTTPSSSYSSVGSAPSRAKKSGVSFETSVMVHPIPSRSSYSDRMRAQLWTPSIELQENAARNCLEFAAEGWDWRRVADDQDMIVYHGERIHPVHFMQEFQPPCNLRDHFVTVLSAQKQEQQT